MKSECWNNSKSRSSSSSGGGARQSFVFRFKLQFVIWLIQTTRTAHSRPQFGLIHIFSFFFCFLLFITQSKYRLYLLWRVCRTYDKATPDCFKNNGHPPAQPKEKQSREQSLTAGRFWRGFFCFVYRHYYYYYYRYYNGVDHRYYR